MWKRVGGSLCLFSVIYLILFDIINIYLLMFIGFWIAVLLYLFFFDRYTFSRSHPEFVFIPDSVGSSAGVYSIQGRRRHMEDTYRAVLNFSGDAMSGFYGVFDGHGGEKASSFSAKHMYTAVSNESLFRDPETALKRGYQQLDRDFLKLAARYDWEDGTTAVVAVLIHNVLYVANCGDSRAVLISGGRAIPMSNDHKPNNESERRRIEKANGEIIFVGTWRVAGILAVARAIGDRHLKQWVIPDPDVQRRVLTRDDDFLILASDGVWDVTSNEEAANIVLSVLSSSGGNLMTAAESLTEHAYREGSLDNITSLVINLKKYR
uniref:Protein phosphatase 2C n=1 Tax=Hirondellea gigas TaxID=1518452 RepID=A0A6A7FWZ6_9CRUS